MEPFVQGWNKTKNQLILLRCLSVKKVYVDACLGLSQAKQIYQSTDVCIKKN